MDPVTLALIGASIGGGIIQAAGQRQPKSISVEWLKKHFGADAVNEELISLFNQMINSPYGQQLIESASVQGQEIEQDIARRNAAAGMGPAGGAESGASIFSQAAAGQAGQGLRRQARADIYKAALPAAQQIVQGRMSAAVGSEMQRSALEAQTPSPMQMIGESIGRGAVAGLSVPRPGAAPTTAGTGAPRASLEVPGLPAPVYSQADIAAAQADAARVAARSPWMSSRLRSRFAGPRLVTTGVQP